VSEGEIWVDAAVLTTVATDLTSEGSRVHDQACRLDLTPDAGRSSDETARAISGLATTVAGMAEHLGTVASTLSETIAGYQASDARGLERMNGTGAAP